MIRKLLDISTAHITQSTDKDFTNKTGDYNRIVVDSIEYGYLITISDFYDIEAFAENWNNVSQDLKDIINYARSLDCDFIKLDCDAEIMDDLPQYEWE